MVLDEHIWSFITDLNTSCVACLMSEEAGNRFEKIPSPTSFYLFIWLAWYQSVVYWLSGTGSNAKPKKALTAKCLSSMHKKNAVYFLLLRSFLKPLPGGTANEQKTQEIPAASATAFWHHLVRSTSSSYCNENRANNTPHWFVVWSCLNAHASNMIKKCTLIQIYISLLLIFFKTNHLLHISQTWLSLSNTLKIS